jgi:hypothetical protein
MKTHHSSTRAQQRGVPPLIDHWLDQYGEEKFDGHGGVIQFFNHRSIRTIERNEGREPVRRLWEYLDSYKVVSSHDGHTITLGKRFRRIRNP